MVHMHVFHVVPQRYLDKTNSALEAKDTQEPKARAAVYTGDVLEQKQPRVEKLSKRWETPNRDKKREGTNTKWNHAMRQPTPPTTHSVRQAELSYTCSPDDDTPLNRAPLHFIAIQTE